MPSFQDHVLAQQLADLPGSGAEWVGAAWRILRDWLWNLDDTRSERALEPWRIALEGLATCQVKNQIWVDDVARLLAKQREAGARVT